MSQQNRETLKSTIYNLSDGDAALYAALASMTDEQIEQVLTEICSKVAVMENGIIVEQGDVFDIFAKPQNEVTKRFIRSTSSLTKIEKLTHVF